AGEAVALRELRLPRVVGRAHFARVDEEQAARRIVGGRPEVGAAGDVRTGDLALFVRRVTDVQDRPAVAPDLRRPRRLHERLADDDAAVGAIDRVVEAVAV